MDAPGATRVGVRERITLLVQSRRGAWVVAALALALTLPATAIGFSTDDYIHSHSVRERLDRLNLFEIVGDDVTWARNNGVLVWWSSPELHVKFLRPLAALTHVVDFTLWPHAAWFMHLINGLIYAATAAVVWLLYREFFPNERRLAAMAAIMFAIDEGHSPAIGWISSRNTVLANLFAFLTLLFHVRTRVRSRSTGFLLVSAACLALALFSAEAGVAALAYLFAYALVFETGSWGKRVASLVPALTVFGVWATCYFALHCGVRGAGFYRELSSPLAAITQGVLDLPTLLFALFGPSVIGPTIVLDAGVVRAVTLASSLPLMAALFLALPRTRENAFFALGALFCLPPIFLTLPQDRLLITASFGAFGLLASFIAVAKTSANRLVRGTRNVFIALHFVIAPVLFVLMLNQGGPIDHGVRDIAAAIPRQAPSQVILVNAPIELLSMYSWYVLLEDKQRTQPSAIHELYAGGSSLEATRIDANTLELTAARGWARIPTERVFGSVANMPRAGSELSVQGLKILVRETEPDGRPKRVQFRFPTPLESSDRLWLEWRGTSPQRWEPPPIGGRATFEPLSMFTSLKP
jgi:hypothetical protein